MSEAHLSRRMETWRRFLRAHARLIERVEQELADAGVIGLDWYDALSALAAAPERRLRMGELARGITLNRSSLSRLADRLEQVGFIQRAPTPGDRRGAYAVLTEAGAAALSRAEPVYTGAVLTVFGNHLTDEISGTLASFFEDLAERLDRDVPELRRRGRGARPVWRQA